LHHLLSIDEVASALGISRAGVYRIIRRNELQVVKLGARTLIRPEALAGLVERKTIGGAPMTSPLEIAVVRAASESSVSRVRERTRGGGSHGSTELTCP
jgi:excisionase family DNA binding protein